jgi:hypothetical protein
MALPFMTRYVNTAANLERNSDFVTARTEKAVIALDPSV